MCPQQCTCVGMLGDTPLCNLESVKDGRLLSVSHSAGHSQCAERAHSVPGEWLS